MSSRCQSPSTAGKQAHWNLGLQASFRWSQATSQSPHLLLRPRLPPPPRQSDSRKLRCAREPPASQASIRAIGGTVRESPLLPPHPTPSQHLLGNLLARSRECRNTPQQGTKALWDEAAHCHLPEAPGTLSLSQTQRNPTKAGGEAAGRRGWALSEPVCAAKVLGRVGPARPAPSPGLPPSAGSPSGPD